MQECGPSSNAGCSVPWGPQAASVAFVLPYETNLTVTSQGPGIHHCCEISSTREQGWHHQLHPSLVRITKSKISTITDTDVLVPHCNPIPRSYRVSSQCQHCDSYSATLECTDDSALWPFLILLFTEVAK